MVYRGGPRRAAEGWDKDRRDDAGLLLNFHMLRMKDGLHRYVYEIPE